MTDIDSRYPLASLAASRVPLGGHYSTKLAPIALFVYNRPEHTLRTVESLRANDLAQQSDLFVFADAARNESATAAVGEVRKLIRSIDGFKSVAIVERERNLGLAASVIKGVTQLCEEFGRVIAAEDDLLTAPDFLVFMNSALERYADEPRVFSISGFNFSVSIPKDYSYDAYFAYRSSSWGWGTWKDRWAKVDWSISDYPLFSSDKEMQRLFNRGGEDLSSMLASQMSGKIDSWAIRWAYAHFIHNSAALLSIDPRVYNIGLDASGVHCRRAPFRQSPLTSGKNSGYLFPESFEFNTHFVAEIQRLHRKPLVHKIAENLLRKMPKLFRSIGLHLWSWRHLRTLRNWRRIVD